MMFFIVYNFLREKVYKKKFKRLTALLMSAVMVLPFFGDYLDGTFNIDWGFDCFASAEETEITYTAVCGTEGFLNESYDELF